MTQCIKDGFPDTRQLTNPILRDFWSVQDSLYVSDGVVYFGTRVVVPKRLRKQILEQLHKAHQGVNGMKDRASASVYWPGINLAIRNTRLNCSYCDKNSPSQTREPLLLSELPDWPFQKSVVITYLLRTILIW